MWKQQYLTIKGKITIWNNLALAPLIYVVSVIDTPEKAIKEVDTIIQNCTWKGKTTKISKNTLIQTIEKGGLKLCDFVTKVKSLKLSWVKWLMENNNAKWKVLPQHLYKHNNLSVYFNAYQNKLTNSRIPPFYKDIHNLFMINCKTTPTKANEILEESIWPNNNISIAKKIYTLENMGR